GLREDPRAGGSHKTERIRSLLVAGEVAASVVLLVGAGLLLRALWKVQGTDPGFRTANVLTMRTSLPLPRYGSNALRERLYRHVLTRVRELPGVESAAYISHLPMVMRGGIWGITLEGSRRDEEITVSMRQVTPGFFQTLGIPIVRGRDVADSDVLQLRASATPQQPPDPNAPPDQAIALVSEAFVREAGVDPIGRKFRLLFLEATIVGVVGDIRVRGLERDSEPQIYLASAQIRDNALVFYFPKDLVIRTRGETSGLIPSVRRIVAEADPALPVSDVQTLEEIVRSDTGARRLQASLVAAFAALALLLAAVGIHGLLALTVSQKTREIGVRVALGARPGQVLGMVLRRSARLAAAGILVGAAAAWAGGRLLQALLAGISPSDPPALAAAVILSAGAALLGSLIPAVRALRVDPSRALRSE
ncbi:MAG TPA: FtsX-like permease family protein, partial [Thermoanaerobaculia bacterium]